MEHIVDVALTLVDKIFSWVELLEKCSDKLNQQANEMEERNKKLNVAKVVGSSVSVGGAATATAAGVATFLTAGAALPFLAGVAAIGGAASWLGIANNAVVDVVNAAESERTLKNAEDVVKKIEDLHEEIEELVEKLKEEAQKEGGYDGPCDDDQVTELILRAMAKQVGLIVDDCVSLKKILEEHFHEAVKTAIWSVLKKSMKITLILIAQSVGGKLAANFLARMGGGVLGLTFSVPELVDNCKKLGNSETEACKSLRENARAIRAKSEEMKKDLHQIENVFQRLVRLKRAIEKRGSERSSEDRKILIEFAMESCKDEVTLQWLRENPESDAFFQLIDISDNIVKFLKKKIDEEEKEHHSNIVDIIFVAHGAIKGSMMSASTLCPPRITDVLLYSPWNCPIDAKVAYSVATGRMKLQHREFRCRKEKGCKIPDAEHRPTKLPNEWNSMKKAGDQKIPNIMLSSLTSEDDAWRVFEILEIWHGKAGRNRIVVPFLLPDNSEIRIPFSVFTLALSKALLDSRFEATLHLTACLSRYGNMKIDEDALKKHYACTIDNTAMTSSADLSEQKSDELFRAFKALFG